MVPVFRGKVEGGKLRLENRLAFDMYLLSLQGDVEIRVGKPRKPRSDDQNRWYWKCIVGIPANHFGYSSQEMHDAFKLMFLRREERGKPVTIGSTATLSTKEFSEYVERCLQWCAEQDLIIPNPDQVE